MIQVNFWIFKVNMRQKIDGSGYLLTLGNGGQSTSLFAAVGLESIETGWVQHARRLLRDRVLQLMGALRAVGRVVGRVLVVMGMDVELVKLGGCLDVAVGWRNLLMVRRRSVGWVRGWTLGWMLEVWMTLHLRPKVRLLLALSEVLAVFAVGVEALWVMEWL